MFLRFLKSGPVLITRRVILSIWMMCFLMSMSVAVAQTERRDPFSLDYEDYVVKVAPGDSFVFSVKIGVPDGHFIYDEKTSVFFHNTRDLTLLKTVRPEPQEHLDPFLNKKTLAFLNDFEIKVYFSTPQDAGPGRRTLEALVKYQGCSDDFCYRPVKREILLPVEVTGQKKEWVGTSGEMQGGQIQGGRTHGFAPTQLRSSFWNLLKESNPETLLNLSRPHLLFLAILAGFLTAFTPCVLPIIPLTLAFIGIKKQRRNNFFRAFLLVLGMVSMYAALGFFSATLGLKLGFLFQTRIFHLITALFFLIFALGLLGIIPFHLPSTLQHKLTQAGGDHPWGIFLAGLTVGFIASPCVGPLMGPLLLIAAKGQDRLFGFILLFGYGMGMGLPFIFLGALYGKLDARITSGRWNAILHKSLALVMLVPAIFYALIFVKPYLGEKKDPMWIYNFDEGVALAKIQDKPILIDFYADWCPPCIELDKKTFSHQSVRQFATHFIMLKIDCTFDDANCQKATREYEVVGWPSVLFTNSEGSLISDTKLIGGFADKEQMLSLMRRALEKTK